MKKNALIWLFFLLLVCLFASTAAAADVVESGTCGIGLTWTLDDEGTLTVEGTGAMNDYFINNAPGGQSSVLYPWYSYREEITNAVISTGVTRIGNHSFSDCKALTTVSISDTVEQIGNMAFYECKQLKEIHLPESVSVIGNGAFSNCTALTTVELSPRLTSIGNEAFGWCESLENISDLPEGITSLSPGVFDSCVKLKKIVFPSTLTSIDYRAFYFCESLENVEFPSSLTTIEGLAFCNCMSFTSITIPAGVREVGDSAFSACYSVESVTIEDGLTQISSRMLQGCSSLKNYEIPSSVTSIGDHAFESCNSLIDITIPEGVRTIGTYAFACGNIQTISLPNSLISVGENAFIGGRYRSVHIPSGLRIIGARAFGNIDNTEFTVAEDNNYFCAEDGILYNKAKTKLVQFPRLKCQDLTVFTVPDGVKTIGTYAFSECFFERIVLPDTLTAINADAFYNCDWIRTVHVPDGVRTIGNEAFLFCDGLTSIRLPASLTSIGQRAFESCSALSSVDYNGARCQWERISIGASNTELTNAALSVASEHVSVQQSEETVPATCFAVGERVITESCSVCKTFIRSTTEELPQLPHSLVSHEGKAPTATEAGWAPYETCENCDYTTFAEIPPITLDPYEALSFLFENGILTVSGSGTVPSVTDAADAPFAAYAEDCRAVVISDGIDAVAADAFAGLEQMEMLILNGSASLAADAFTANASLATVICAQRVQFDAAAFADDRPIAVYEPEQAGHTGSLPAGCAVLPYSFADGTLTVKGGAEMDVYTLLDLMAVMCSYYDGIRFVRFDSYTSLDVPFYVFSKTEKDYVPAENNTLEGVSFSVMVPGERDWESVSFNAFCSLGDTHDLRRFRLVADTETGEEVRDNDFEIREENPVIIVIKRVLKWITSLLNMLFRIFSRK